jgi:hypothetical protein
MARSFINALSGASQCSECHTQLHLGVDDFNDHYNNHDRRNRHDQKIWWRLLLRQWGQLNPFRSYRSQRDHLFLNDGRGGVSVRNHYPQCNRPDGRNDNRSDHRYRIYYQLLIGLLAITFGLKANAETTAIANPVATSSGSVNNQAVQINQGGYSTQGFGAGHQCNSSTLVLTPFYLGNDVHQKKHYVRNSNFGAQVTLSVPLDGGMVELCKALGRAKVRREQLNYEIARALRCAELQSKGFTFHPESQFLFLCADIVPVAALVPKTESVSPEASEPSSPEP